MGYLSRDEILSREDIRTEDVDVPEWGGTVRVRGMSGTKRDEFEDGLTQSKPITRAQRRRGESPQTVTMANIRATLCAWCIVDEGNELIFSDADIAQLGEKSGAALDRAFDVAMRLSGIGEDDVEAMAKAMLLNPSGGSHTD